MAETIQEFAVDLEKVGRALTGPEKQKVLRTCANYQLRAIRDNLRGEHEPDGRPWTPLSELTLRRKRGPQMLWETRSPMQLVRSQEVDAETIAIGTNDPILARHQGGVQMRVTKKQSVWMFYNLFGGLEGGSKAEPLDGARGGPFSMFGKLLKIPARPYLGFSEADKTAHEQIAARWMEKLLAGGQAA